MTRLEVEIETAGRPPQPGLRAEQVEKNRFAALLKEIAYAIESGRQHATLERPDMVGKFRITAPTSAVG